MHCNGCKHDTVFFPQRDSLVKKYRQAREHELRTKCDSQAAVFQLVGKHRTKKHKRNKWTMDSGATVSVTNRLDLLETIDQWHPRKRVQVANGSFVEVTAIGTIRLQVDDDKGNMQTVLLQNVYYSADFSANLLSVDELYRQHRIRSVFGGDSHMVMRDGTKLPIARDEQRRFQLSVYGVMPVSVDLWHRRFMHLGNAALKRLGCVIPELQGTYDFSKCDSCLQGGMARSQIGFTPRRPRPDSAFGKKPKQYHAFGERISSDLCGPFPKAYNGHLYAIVFHDASEKWAAGYTIKDKEAESIIAAFTQFLHDHDQHLPNGVALWHTDNGSEFKNKDMEQFCRELSIRRSYSVPYIPAQNPYAERMWGEVLRRMRIAMVDNHTPEDLWPYAFKQAILIHNITMDDQCTSPYKRIHGVDYDYSQLHVYDCLVYYLAPDRDRPSKLSPRALPARYQGPDPERRGHLLYIPKLGRHTTAYHVVFNEYRSYSSSLERPSVEFHHRSERRSYHHYQEDRDGDNTTDDDDQDVDDDIDNDFRRLVRLRDDLPENRPGYSPASDSRHGTDTHWSDNHCEESQCNLPRGHDGPHSHEQVRSRLRPRAREVYQSCSRDSDCIFHDDHRGNCEDKFAQQICDVCSDHQTVYQCFDSTSEEDPDTVFVQFDDVSFEVLKADLARTFDIPVPAKYEDAVTGHLGPRWKESMRSEIEALLKNKTWETISRSDKRLRGRKPVKSRWVYDIKYNRDGTIKKYKSRFVVCGYSQKQGVDYDRAFSATMRATSFRTLLSIAAGQKLRLMQYDVSNAFTQAFLDDVDIYVEPARGFEEYEIVNGKKISKLLHLCRALYGTKQASRLWQETLRRFLVDEMHFKNSASDPCLYFLREGNSVILLGVYVDDIIVAYRGDDLLKRFDAAFHKRFTATPATKLEWFLGMAVDQHEDYSIDINHALSIEKMAGKLLPGNSVTREYPTKEMFEKLGPAKSAEERARVQKYQYASIIGALLYISVMSRPDTVYYTSVLAKFMSDPSMECVEASYHVIQYLNATRKYVLHYSGRVDVPSGLKAYAPDIERNHGFVGYSDSSWGNEYPYPMFGYGVYLYGGLISFSTKQLKVVAFSSCEAEYAAASYACKEIEFIRNICADLGVMLQGRLVLGLDNTACIDIAWDVGVTGRNKHFDRAIHYLRDLTQMKRILPAYVSTEMQKADGFTKALNKSKYLQWLPCVISKPVG